MNRGHTYSGIKPSDDRGVANMIEYVMVTGIIMVLFITMLLLVHANFVEKPVNTITYSAFTDIGNGLSTRIVDVYAIAPETGNITSNFDLPDDIGGRSYVVEISGDQSGQTVDIFRDSIRTEVALAGVGASKHGQAAGNTTGAGVNRVRYDSEGFNT
jgi:Flp pilus assembly pilin Flp